MAIPLDPETGLFPETLVEPFVVSQEVADLADDVLADFDEFEPIRSAIREAGLAIEYVFETKPFDPMKEEFKPHTVAKVTKASPLWRCLTARELVIQFRQAFWEAFSVEQRRAVLHHELTHIDVDEPDEQGRVHLALRHHDVEDFSRTMRRFGPILPSRAAFVKAYLDWSHEQEQPEPTPLRIAEVIEETIAAVADDVAPDPGRDPAIDGLARDFRRDMEKGLSEGESVTITKGDRSATIRGRGKKPGSP